MRTRHRRTSVVVLLALAALAPGGAGAFDDGDRCVLKSPLEISVRTGGGEVRTLVEAGQPVEVRGVGDFLLRVWAGDTEGFVSTSDLEAACRGSLKLCRLTAPVVMVERPGGDGKTFRIKTGADLSVLRQGKTWGHVRIGDLEGYVKTPELEASCEEGAAASEGGDEAPREARIDGPGILLVPFALATKEVSSDVADAFSTALYDELGLYRPDALWADARDAAQGASRVKALRAAQEEGLARARAQGAGYAVVGRLERYGEGYVLSVVLLEAKSGKIVKAVKARPTSKMHDTWPQATLAVLLPEVPPAPGSRVPKIPLKKKKAAAAP